MRVAIEPWGEGDLPLLERLLGDPAMMEHLGGPESREKIAARHARYLAIADPQFRILADLQRDLPCARLHLARGLGVRVPVRELHALQRLAARPARRARGPPVGALTRAKACDLLDGSGVDNVVTHVMTMASLHDLHEVSRPPSPSGLLALDPAAGALGVAFGANGVRVAVSELSGAACAERHAAGAGADAVGTAVALAEEALAGAGIARGRLVAAALAIPRDSDASPEWGEELARRLGTPVDVDHDANLGALGELARGAAHGLRDIVYVDASWSLGAGLVLDGRLHRGASGLAGALGHVQVDPRGTVCDCGNRGCLQTVASAGALLDRLRTTITPTLTLPGVRLLLAEGHPAAVQAFDDAGHAIGHALAAVCEALNPAAVVIGGELAGFELIAGITAALDRHARVASAGMTVELGILGDRAPVLGALQCAIGSGYDRALGRLGAARR